MKLIKTLFLAAVLLLPTTVFALTDDEQVELSNAIERNEAGVAKRFIDGGLKVNEPVFAWSWLQVAANKNRLEIVKLFVDAGAELNYKHPITKMTALSLAAYNGHAEVVKYLLSKGANPNINLRGNVSIMRILRDEGKTEMFDLLKQNGAKEEGCEDEKCF